MEAVQGHPRGAWIASVVLAVAACGRHVARDGRHNVILISIDTLRPDHLGCYGYERSTSPTLDKLAQAGVRFEDVTAAAPWTLPSHASMLTGLYPAHHGVKSHENRLPDGVITLAEEFHDKGYETLAVVNTHNVGAPEFHLGQGFEHFRYIIEMEDDPVTGVQKVFDSGPTVVSTAKELLRARDPAKPFFLFLHFYDVHTDFTACDEYRDRFVEPYSGRMTGRTTQLTLIRDNGERLNEADLKWLREMYDAEICQLDELLGRFFAWLEEEELGQDTFFVVTSDHGEEFQEHGNVLHGRTHYQEVLRVPLLVKGPGIPAGVVVKQPVDGVDVTPTILALTGIASRQPRDGLDLSPTWKGGTLPARPFFGEADHNNKVDGQPVTDVKKMIRDGSSKFLLDTQSQAIELYDLAQDPHEQHDLAPGDPARAARLRAELEQFLQSTVQSEEIPPPSEEEQRKLKALGY